MSDPFAVLGLPRRFDVDLAAAEKNHRELSKALHPDRYARAGASERQAALSRAIEVNEAWRVVRDPVRRAEAIFRLAGLEVGETHEPKASLAFLMDIMERREALAEAKAARDPAAVRKLAAGVEERARSVEAELANVLVPGEQDAERLRQHLGRLGELRFYRRFLEEVGAIEELLEAS